MAMQPGVSSNSATEISGTPVASARRKYRIVLIKPSHYDTDGYVIQWWRSTIPSNSLASVYGLLRECAEANALGPDVDIEIEAYDECNTVIDVKKTVREHPQARAAASSRWSACSPTNIRARSISPASSARRTSRSRSAASMSAA